jgi:hypothetical protein
LALPLPIGALAIRVADRHLLSLSVPRGRPINQTVAVLLNRQRDFAAGLLQVNLFPQLNLSATARIFSIMLSGRSDTAAQHTTVSGSKRTQSSFRFADCRLTSQAASQSAETSPLSI